MGLGWPGGGWEGSRGRSGGSRAGLAIWRRGTDFFLGEGPGSGRSTGVRAKVRVHSKVPLS